MFSWTADMIRFMKDACEYTGYYRTLAEHIAPLLPKNAHVCDAGCGAGYLAYSILPYAAKVTAIDASNGMLELLRKKNTPIEIRCADVFESPPQSPYDAMLCCFFGGTAEALSLAKAQCKSDGRLFLVKKDWTARRFVTRKESVERHSAAECVKELDALAIPYTLERLSLEMGQPFRSFEDALLFFSAYNFSDTPVDENSVRERLIADPTGEYAYYMPSKKTVGLFMLQIRDIPDPLPLF